MQQFDGYQFDSESGLYFRNNMPAGARREIARAYKSGARIRIFWGDTETGRAWAEEHDILGTVGRSMGPCKIPLLIETPRARGGGEIGGHIVAIQTAPGVFGYKHANFDPGQWTTGPGGLPEYPEGALHNGELHARFKNPGQAARFCEFMRGDKWTKGGRANG